MKLKITVHGVAYEVDVEVLDAKDEMQNGVASPLPEVPAPAPVSAAAPIAAPAPRPAAAASGTAGNVASPIAGTVIEVKCKPQDKVQKGQALLVIEAMKMETTIAAPVPGTVKSVAVAAGDAVREGETLVEFE